MYYKTVVEEYDPSLDIWVTKTSTQSYKSCTIQVNGKIYSIGGTDSNGNRLSLVKRKVPEVKGELKKVLEQKIEVTPHKLLE